MLTSGKEDHFLVLSRLYIMAPYTRYGTSYARYGILMYGVLVKDMSNLFNPGKLSVWISRRLLPVVYPCDQPTVEKLSLDAWNVNSRSHPMMRHNEVVVL